MSKFALPQPARHPRACSCLPLWGRWHRTRKRTVTERATARRSVIRSISAPRNVPNEITIDPYTTKTTKRLFFGHFVAFVEIVAFVLFVGYRETVEIVDFVIPLGGREIVISLKSLVSLVSGGTVKPLKSLISLGPLRLRDALLGATKKDGCLSASVFWSEQRDLNPRPPSPEPGALPAALCPENTAALRLRFGWG